MKRTHGWIALGAVLLFVSLSVLRRMDGGARGTEGLTGARMQGGNRQELQVAPGTRPDTADNARLTALPKPASPATPAIVATPGHDRAACFILHCIDARTGISLPGTELWIAHRQAILGRCYPEDWRFLLDEEVFAQELGVRFTANGWGELLLDLGEVELYASARHGDSWGKIAFTPRVAGYEEVRLEPDQTLVLQVVDEEENPRAGVPVALVCDCEPDLPYFVWRGSTRGDRGLATVRHYQIRNEHEEACQLSATLAFPPRGLSRVPFDPAAPPEEPVRLVLPATGSLAIRIEDERGRPCEEGLFVHLQGVGEVGVSIMSGSLSQPQRKELTRSGCAFFPHVGLGLELKVSAEGVQEYRIAEARILGPREPGERVEHTLQFGARHPILTGRLLHRSGVPVVEGQALWKLIPTVRGSRRWHPWGRFHTGEEGGFRIAIDCELPAEGSRVLHIWLREAAPAPEYRHELELPLNAEETDLGSVTLREPELKVAGQLIDGCDRPVESSLVTLSRSDRSGYHKTVAETRTDERGAFRFYGPLGPGKYWLKSEDFSYRQTAVPAALGDLNVTVGIPGGTSLAGYVLFDEGVPAEELLVSCCPGASRNGDERRATRVRKGGRFWLTELTPGNHEVLVHHKSVKCPPLTAPLVVDAGRCQKLFPPALQGIDLRGLLFPFRLRIIDLDGRPLAGKIAHGPASERSGTKLTAGFEDGECVFYSRRPDVNLAVACPGHRFARLDGVSGDREIVMRPALEIRLRVEGGLSLPEEHHLSAELVPVEIGNEPMEESLWDSISYVFLQGDSGRVVNGQASLRLPAAGTWRLRWNLESAKWYRSRYRPVEVPATLTFRIEETDARQEFWATSPPQVSIDEAIKSFSWRSRR